MPTNYNGGSSADSGVFRPGGMLGPLIVRNQSSPDPLVQPDRLRPPLFRGGAGEPLFLLLLHKLSGMLAWLSMSNKRPPSHDDGASFPFEGLCDGRRF